MWKLLAFLPSLLSGGLEYLNKKQDVNLEKYKVDGKIDEALVSAEIAIIQARASVLPHLTWLHYGFGSVALIYWTAIVYDALTEKLFPSVHWDVMSLDGLAGVTFNAVVGFLFLQSSVSAIVAKVRR